LEKAAYCYASEYNARFGKRIHTGFKFAQFQIAKLFEEVYEYETATRDRDLEEKDSSLMGDDESLDLVS
jgi:hypothetical protein